MKTTKTKTTKILFCISILLLLQPLLWASGDNENDNNDSDSKYYDRDGDHDGKSRRGRWGHCDAMMMDGSMHDMMMDGSMHDMMMDGFGRFGNKRNFNLNRIFRDKDSNQSLTASDLSSQDQQELQKIYSSFLILNQARQGLVENSDENTDFTRQNMGGVLLDFHADVLNHFELEFPSDDTGTDLSSVSNVELLKQLASTSANGLQDLESWNSNGMHSGLVPYITRVERIYFMSLKTSVYELTLEGESIDATWRTLLKDKDNLLAMKWSHNSKAWNGGKGV